MADGAAHISISLSRYTSFGFFIFLSTVGTECHCIISCCIVSSSKTCYPKDYTIVICQLTELNFVAPLLLFGGSEGAHKATII